MLQPGPFGQRQPQQDLDGTFLVRNMHQTDLGALHRHAQRLDDVLRRHAGQRGLGPVHREDILDEILSDEVIHIHDAGRGLEQRPEVLRDRPLLAIDRVRYRGEPVAAVAAVSPEAARAAAALLKVEIAPLPVAVTGARPGEEPLVHLTDLLRRGALADQAPLVPGDTNVVAQSVHPFGPTDAPDFPDRTITVDELQGGTFTITNGGIFGSMLSTPILNPPQSGILGMHAIKKRPVVVDDQVVVRPMMYLALSYDHRIIDGREAVSFLVRIKDCLEDPGRILLEL